MGLGHDRDRDFDSVGFRINLELFREFRIVARGQMSEGTPGKPCLLFWGEIRIIGQLFKDPRIGHPILMLHVEESFLVLVGGLTEAS